MKNILLIYRGNHASHRLANATMSQYESNFHDCKDLFNLHLYCIGKKSQMRLDRFIERNNISVVYIHQEEIEPLKTLQSLNIEYHTYTRNDFVIRHKYSYSYVVEYEYTLIDELITGEKNKHGKISKYKYGMGEITKCEIFKCDEKKYDKRYYFDSEKEAIIAYIKYLEEWKSKEEKNLEDMIKNQKKKIKDISININKYNKILNKGVK